MCIGLYAMCRRVIPCRLLHRIVWQPMPDTPVMRLTSLTLFAHPQSEQHPSAILRPPSPCPVRSHEEDRRRREIRSGCRHIRISPRLAGWRCGTQHFIEQQLIRWIAAKKFVVFDNISSFPCIISNVATDVTLRDVCALNSNFVLATALHDLHRWEIRYTLVPTYLDRTRKCLNLIPFRRIW